jgi:hypothetical protein
MDLKKPILKTFPNDRLNAKCQKSLPYQLNGRRQRMYHVQILNVFISARDDIFSEVVTINR